MSITMILNILTENRIMLIEAILGNILICIAVYTLFGKRKYVWFFPAACGVRYIFYNIGLFGMLCTEHKTGTKLQCPHVQASPQLDSSFLPHFFGKNLWQKF